jgi:hypothetical protein
VDGRLSTAVVIMAHPDPSDQPNPEAPLTENMLLAAASDERSLPVHEAASFLHISPATLRAWEREFGFPASVRSEHPTPTYLIAELLALQDALPDASSVTSAIHTARRRIDRTLESSPHAAYGSNCTSSALVGSTRDAAGDASELSDGWS